MRFVQQTVVQGKFPSCKYFSDANTNQINRVISINDVDHSRSKSLLRDWDKVFRFWI